MRLRTKYAIALLATMLVLGGVLYGSTEQFKQQLIDQERQEVVRTANLTAGQVDRAIRDRVEYVRWFAGRPPMTDLAAADRNLAAFVRGSNFYAAQLVSPNGTVIAFEGEINETQADEVVGTNVSERPYIQEIQEPIRSAVISAPERAEGDFTLVTVSAKILGSDGNESVVRGYLVGALKLDASDFFVATEPLETSTQTVEVVGENANGTVLTLNSAASSFDSVLSSSATIESTDWELTVRRDRSGLTGRLNVLRTVQGAGLLLVLLSFVALGVLEYRTNLRQTRRLLEGFAALEDGRFDYEVSLDAAQEWRQMSEGFNQLAAGLASRERAIREREQQLSVLNRILRHNLKNEMSVIRGHSELLPTLEERSRREQSSEKIQNAADRLLSHSEKASHIESAIESADAGRTTIDCERVAATVESVAREFPEAELEVDVPDGVRIHAISAFERAVESIVENAFEHNDSDSPWVRVWVEQEDDTVSVCIADNGPGIPSHEIEVLEQTTETALEHGSGVGLWLTYWIVKHSGGTLQFSHREPSGTVVTIKVQRASEED